MNISSIISVMVLMNGATLALLLYLRKQTKTLGKKVLVALLISYLTWMNTMYMAQIPNMPNEFAAILSRICFLFGPMTITFFYAFMKAFIKPEELTNGFSFTVYGLMLLNIGFVAVGLVEDGVILKDGNPYPNLKSFHEVHVISCLAVVVLSIFLFYKEYQNTKIELCKRQYACIGGVFTITTLGLIITCAVLPALDIFPELAFSGGIWPIALFSGVTYIIVNGETFPEGFDFISKKASKPKEISREAPSAIVSSQKDTRSSTASKSHFSINLEDNDGDLSDMEFAEKKVIEHSLKKNNLNRTKTKQELKISVNTLRAKIQKYGLENIPNITKKA